MRNRGLNLFVHLFVRSAVHFFVHLFVRVFVHHRDATFGLSLHHRCADFREGEEQATGDALVRAIGDATAKSRFILGSGQSAAATRNNMSEEAQALRAARGRLCGFAPDLDVSFVERRGTTGVSLVKFAPHALDDAGSLRLVRAQKFCQTGIGKPIAKFKFLRTNGGAASLP